MLELTPAIGIMIIAAITPGPNNVFVMTAAMQDGILAAFRTIVAIVAGSLILFVLVRFGLDAISQRVPLFRTVIGLFGSIYLGWLGVALIRSKTEPANVDKSTRQKSVLGLVLFQLFNPKSWVLVSVFLAASGQAQTTILVSILIIVTFGCLSVWALAGIALSRLYETASGHLWIDRLMGTGLISFAALLALQAISGI